MVRVISILVGILMSCYIIFASVFFHDKKRHDVCKELQIVVKDSLDKHFVTENDIIDQLKRASLNPVEKPMSEVNTNEIETELLKNEMIASVEAYKTPSGILKLEVKQKLPVLRVMGAHGNFYVDNKGSTMPISRRYAVHVPVATGYVEKEFAMSDLYKFALFLQKDDFWNSQIEQIYVNSAKEVELIPRVGSHRILLGSFDRYEEKLNNLQLFYKQVIPKMGWDKYSIINLKYKEQIVCTKNK